MTSAPGGNAVVSGQITGQSGGPPRRRWPAAATHPVFAALERGRAVLREAASADSDEERFRLAHLAALRAAAALLADRGRPASARRRLVSVWVLIEAVAPEYGQWARAFAAAAPSRAAVEAGVSGVVDAVDADAEFQRAVEFIDAVASGVGLLTTAIAS